jgi:aminoacyl-tRNA hydrolase
VGLYRTAHAYRHALLRRVTFIGVTGSSGKTTTKELLGAILSSRLRGVTSFEDRNVARSNARTILKHARPWHDFCLLEVGLGQQPLDRSVDLVLPRIGVVTTVGTEHINAFHTIEAIAAEKSKLVTSLPPDGTAVLNADDPRVLAMQAQCLARVLTYGVAPSAMVRAQQVVGRWPAPLRFSVVHAGRSYPVQTQLFGPHWVSSVLAALTAALAMDIPLAHAVEVVATVPPFPRRLTPVSSPDGVTFIRDDVKAPLWSIPLALQFLKVASADRKIVVMGTISDYVGDSDNKYRAVAREALEVSDHVLFVGSNAGKVLRGKQHGRLSAAPTVSAAQQQLERMLQPGDLVLLKGSRADRLELLLDTRIAPPAPPRAAAAPAGTPGNTGSSVQVIVGLGNPGETYTDTPHNVGQRAVELLAESMSASWVAEREAMVARVEHPRGMCYLVKPLTKMNVTGPALRQLGERLGFGAAECILLQDDIDLPIGAVRMREAGGDGGHRGVRSVLEAFETFAIRRVKIGVGRPQEGADAARHVVAAFGPTELAVIDKACAQAVLRAREFAGFPPPRRADRLTPSRSGTPPS